MKFGGSPKKGGGLFLSLFCVCVCGGGVFEHKMLY